MTSFNLISEPWIPCVAPDGSHQQLGLQDTLVRAHELREIFTQSPLVTGALHRLLLALLHRNFGPPDLDAWKKMFAAGTFDAVSLSKYFDKWSGRFNLFDPAKPFYQSTDSDLQEGARHPISLLAHELASGNNATLFDHNVNATPKSVSASTAAQFVVAAQCFALGGGVSKPFNLMHAPLVGCVHVLVRGQTLFESLMLNLLVYGADGPLPTAGEDRPVWESEKPSAAKRPPSGYLDYLTWQSRRIRLEPEADGRVQWARLCQGDAVAGDALIEPMCPLFCRDEIKGFQPLRLQKERAMWRDAHVLLARHGNMARRPRNLDQLCQIDLPQLEGRVALDLCGLCNDKAKVDFWRHERLPLPLAYLHDDMSVAYLELSLQEADAAGGALRQTVWDLAKRILDPDDKGVDKARTSALATAMPSLRAFWGALDLHFSSFFERLPREGLQALEEWRALLRRQARAALELACCGLDGSARALKACTEARRVLNYKLRNVLPDNQKEEEQQHAVTTVC